MSQCVYSSPNDTNRLTATVLHCVWLGWCPRHLPKSVIQHSSAYNTSWKLTKTDIAHKTELPECTSSSAQSHRLRVQQYKVSASWDEGRQMETGTADRDIDRKNIKFSHYGLPKSVAIRKPSDKLKVQWTFYLFCCQKTKLFICFCVYNDVSNYFFSQISVTPSFSISFFIFIQMFLAF